MAPITPLSIDTAPDASKPLLEKAKAAYSFLPNLLGNMAHAPALLEGYMMVATIFKKTSFTDTEQQIVLMSNNLLNGCKYCMAAHTTIAQGAGVADDVIEALRTNTPIKDPKLEALRQFSQVMNISRGNPRPNDLKAFLAAGYTEANILEVILGTAMKTLSNYTNHLSETPVDDAFADNAWSADMAQ